MSVNPRALGREIGRRHRWGIASFVA